MRSIESDIISTERDGALRIEILQCFVVIATYCAENFGSMSAERGRIIERCGAVIFERIAEELQHSPAYRMGQCRHHLTNRSERLS